MSTVSEYPRMTGFILALLSWVAAWGLIDLFVTNWSIRQKFWFYVGMLLFVIAIAYQTPAVLEYF